MIARQDLWDEVADLLRANRRLNVVEEALRYRSLRDLSDLPTDQLMALAARTAATASPLAQRRSFGEADLPAAASAGSA